MKLSPAEAQTPGEGDGATGSEVGGTGTGGSPGEMQQNITQWIAQRVGFCLAGMGWLHGVVGELAWLLQVFSLAYVLTLKACF